MYWWCGIMIINGLKICVIKKLLIKIYIHEEFSKYTFKSLKCTLIKDFLFVKKKQKISFCFPSPNVSWILVKYLFDKNRKIPVLFVMYLVEYPLLLSYHHHHYHYHYHCLIKQPRLMNDVLAIKILFEYKNSSFFFSIIIFPHLEKKNF